MDLIGHELPLAFLQREQLPVPLQSYPAPSRCHPYTPRLRLGLPDGRQDFACHPTRIRGMLTVGRIH